MNLVVVILAAGKGTRMKSITPKVLHKVDNKTMIERVVHTSKNLDPNEIVVVVSKENIKQISKTVYDVRYQIQNKQLGTGHAVKTALSCCDTSNLLGILGDVPLITADTLKKVISTKYDAVIVGFLNNDHTNKFGRIIAESNKVKKIVEYSEATESERKINLCNSGIMWIKSDYLDLIYDINNKNSKGEYYLTDLIHIMVQMKLQIGYLQADIHECMGVNTQEDLKTVNKLIKRYKSDTT